MLVCRMLAGQLPWGPNAAPALVMMRIVSHAPPAPSSLNPGLSPAPAQTPRRSGLLVLLFLFLGVNSVVLALVDWDKLGTRLPWDTSSAPPSAR